MPRRTCVLLIAAALAVVGCSSNESGGSESDTTTSTAVNGDSTQASAEPADADPAGATESAVPLTDADAGLDPFVVTEPAPADPGTSPALAAATAAADAAEAAGSFATPADAFEARQQAAVEAAQGAGLPEVVPPASPAGVGIYGGSGENVCDVEGIIAFLQQNEAEALAWASVQGIGVEEIPDYLRSLTPGRLVADTDVLNHGFRDGAVRPHPSRLAAGTAVLVDADGVPRVRCKCGNPLKPADIEISGDVIGPEQWADAVVDASISEGVAGGREAVENILGPIDFIARGDDPAAYLSLGNAETECEFYVTVEFIDNRLIDGPGEDLRTFEVGSAYGGGGSPEAHDVYVDLDGEFVFVGQLAGNEAGLDLAGQIGDAEIAVIRICDATAGSTPNPAPGPDLDAVATINWVPG